MFMPILCCGSTVCSNKCFVWKKKANDQQAVKWVLSTYCSHSFEQNVPEKEIHVQVKNRIVSNTKDQPFIYAALLHRTFKSASDSVLLLVFFFLILWRLHIFLYFHLDSVAGFDSFFFVFNYYNFSSGLDSDLNSNSDYFLFQFCFWLLLFF